MSAFEFFFSFFGLILGLSVVEVMTGVARVLKQRRRIKVGYVTPLLAVLLLVDLASFWANTWGMLQDIQISLGLLVVGVMVAGVYFLAASMVFADDLDEWPSLDAFYDAHKRWVVGGVWLANMLSGFAFTAFVTTPAEYWSGMISLPSLITVGWFTAVMGGVALFRDHRINAALLVIGLSGYVL
ncbi:hypothetical protein [Brevundimonas sp. NIBR11]|uniref:hypothetical protein n=1 Tax=Brevundimonas sp. NIBR11 TaxID=3015999 RepID=UPI0022F0627E|nr:hypothetical protein [Brevundimonas sp. NIBR11]WGM31293.1 hypothetical protein KKHFBJBL_01537 [Brevundimonas sp. NIBR11]